MKMMEGYLEVYVIIVSSAIILGTSFATVSSAHVNATWHQNQRWGMKVNFYNLVKPNASLSISDRDFNETQSGHSEKPKVLQTSHVPFSFTKPYNDSIEQLNETHPYFALFDPLYNATRKVEALRHSKHSLISYKDFNSLLEESKNGEHFEKKKSQMDCTRGKKIKNFIEWDTMRDSEKEVRFHYNGIVGKETVVRTGTDEDTGKRQGLKLRQLTDGTHFIQLIYNFDDEIQDCEYIKQKSAVEKFLKTFRKNVENAKRIYEEATESNALGVKKTEMNDDYLEDDDGKIEMYFPDSESGQYEGEDFEDLSQEYRNVTFQIVQRVADLPKELAEWMSYPKLKRQCRENHEVLKQLAYNKKHGDEKAKKMAEQHIERFRACLKMAKTGTANFVGKLFFNVVQTKCFVLKPQEVCSKYSWWGKCEKKEYRRKAYLKDNLSY